MSIMSLDSKILYVILFSFEFAIKKVRTLCWCNFSNIITNIEMLHKVEIWRWLKRYAQVLGSQALKLGHCGWNSQPFTPQVFTNILIFVPRVEKRICSSYCNNFVDEWSFPVGWCSVVWVKWKWIASRNTWITRIANERIDEKGNDQHQCAFNFLYGY